MIITEAQLRDQLRRPTAGAQVVVPEGARLSPSAKDFVKQFSLVLVTGNPNELANQEEPVADSAWDKASVFPVDFAGERPVCHSCGMTVTSKASALTQLNSAYFAPKTHPRIKLRGKVDSLHSLVLLIQRLASNAGEQQLAAALGTVAAYCRELTSAEYHERDVAPFQLGEVSSEEIHRATHDPMGQLGLAHLTIDEREPELQHWLNVARTTSRELEILALETFTEPGGFGESITAALNRLSSVFYYLQLRLAKGQG